ncbi:MAG: DUF4224 domain-containing protein [Pseudomonadota bacterium]
MFLTRDEIAELTERRQAAAQIRWLTDHGWKFEVGMTGRPKVMRAEAEQRMIGKQKPRERHLKSLAA